MVGGTEKNERGGVGEGGRKLQEIKERVWGEGWRWGL